MAALAITGRLIHAWLNWNCSGVCFQPLQLAASNPAAAHVSLWNLPFTPKLCVEHKNRTLQQWAARGHERHATVCMHERQATVCMQHKEPSNNGARNRLRGHNQEWQPAMGWGLGIGDWRARLRIYLVPRVMTQRGSFVQSGRPLQCGIAWHESIFVFPGRVSTSPLPPAHVGQYTLENWSEALMSMGSMQKFEALTWTQSIEPPFHAGLPYLEANPKNPKNPNDKYNVV